MGMKQNLRMYILVKEDAPLGLAMAAVGHAALGCYLKYKDHPDMKEWLETSYRKVVCKVNKKEFDAAVQQCPENLVFTEEDWKNDDQEIAVAFVPRIEWPKRFHYFRLYRDKENEQALKKVG